MEAGQSSILAYLFHYLPKTLFPNLILVRKCLHGLPKHAAQVADKAAVMLRAYNVITAEGRFHLCGIISSSALSLDNIVLSELHYVSKDNLFIHFSQRFFFNSS